MGKNFSILCVCVLFLSACSSSEDNQSRELAPLPEVTCVAVLPVMIPVAVTSRVTAERKKVLLAGASYLNSVMATEFGDGVEYKLLTENQLDAILGDPWGGRAQQVKVIGEATRCGVVLETSLTRYRDRVGTPMSAETPASAAVSMELIDATSGAVLWTSSFDETQKALFEDIFSFDKAQKRGFKWLSVEELSGDGLKSRLIEVPFFKEEAAE